jgi:hypothetical protein
MGASILNIEVPPQIGKAMLVVGSARVFPDFIGLPLYQSKK